MNADRQQAGTPGRAMRRGLRAAPGVAGLALAAALTSLVGPALAAGAATWTTAAPAEPGAPNP